MSSNMNDTKKTFQYSVFPLVFLVSVFVVSCDSLGTADTERPNHDSLITFIIQRPFSHGKWKDEVIVHSSGRVDFRRLEGEEIPSATRVLSDDEFQEITNLFTDFYALENDCPRYNENGVEFYTITYHGERGEKTVRCDMSSVSRIPENEKLKPIVRLLRDFRMSLIGEERFAGQLSFELRPERTDVDLDEPVVLQYSVTNETNEEVEIGFSSSAQLGFKIYQEGEVIFSSGAFGYLGVLTSWKIPPFSTGIKEYEWDHSSFDGSIYHDRKVKSGTYTIIQFLQNGNSPYRSTEITITEQGDQALQPRVVYNRHDDPSAFIYELNNRISASFSFDFSTDRKVGFRIREYDVHSQTAGEIVYSNTTGNPSNTHLNIEPFEEYVWNETWDRRDNEGNPVPQGFYRAEMWLMDQEPEYRAGRRVFIDD